MSISEDFVKGLVKDIDSENVNNFLAQAGELQDLLIEWALKKDITQEDLMALFLFLVGTLKDALDAKTTSPSNT